MSRRSTTPSPSGDQFPTLAKMMSQGSTSSTNTATTPTLTRNMTSSRRSTTPIVFSRSTVDRKKPQPIEKKLECTLEELCFGAVRKIKIKRNVITDYGMIVQEEETLKIKVKPGWKKGTKVTFEGKGDENPGYHPADVVFVIDEKKHQIFKRIGDDLELGVEVPLVKALTGCSISVPLLGGERMTLGIDYVINPGDEKVIKGQGMPKSKDEEASIRGDLRLKFLVKFPEELTQEQRSNIHHILQG